MYKHLNPEQRYTIDVPLQQKKKQERDLRGHKNPAIHPPCRELRRNGGQRGCHCKQAQAKADDRKRRLQNYRGLTTGLRKFIRDKITGEQWPPAQIVGHLRKGGGRNAYALKPFTPMSVRTRRPVGTCGSIAATG